MSYIITFSGKRIYFNDIHKSEFCIEDIAHSLAKLCRYNGHLGAHYSVAQHCVLASIFVASPDENELYALLHDASEAYMGDLPSPLKALLPDYKALESKLQVAIQEHFSLEGHTPQAVHEIDMHLCATEMRDLFVPSQLNALEHPLEKPLESLPFKIKPWSVDEAKDAFLSRFHQLTRPCRPRSMMM